MRAPEKQRWVLLCPQEKPSKADLAVIEAVPNLAVIRKRSDMVLVEYEGDLHRELACLAGWAADKLRYSHMQS